MQLRVPITDTNKVSDMGRPGIAGESGGNAGSVVTEGRSEICETRSVALAGRQADQSYAICDAHWQDAIREFVGRRRHISGVVERVDSGFSDRHVHLEAHILWSNTVDA